MTTLVVRNRRGTIQVLSMRLRRVRFRRLGTGAKVRILLALCLAGVSVVFAACGETDLVALVASGAASSGAASSGVGSSGSGGASAGTGTSAANTGVGDGGASLPVAKRGMAYGYNSFGDLQALSQSGVPGVHWWLNWTTHPDDSLDGGPDYHLSGVEYVPMLWDLQTQLAFAPNDSRYVLTFYEPNNPRQSNTTPVVAASSWQGIVNAAHNINANMKIVAPSVEFGCTGCTDPVVWLTDFFLKCGVPQACHVDFLGMTVHSCDVNALNDALTKLKQSQFSQYASKIWVTQVSCDTGPDGSVPSEIDEETYMNLAVGALEVDPSVFRYAWYTGRPRPLSDGGSAGSLPEDLFAPCSNPCAPDASGILTPLGQLYVQAWASAP